jgi:hypothetical protein
VNQVPSSQVLWKSQQIVSGWATVRAWFATASKGGALIPHGLSAALSLGFSSGQAWERIHLEWRPSRATRSSMESWWRLALMVGLTSIFCTCIEDGYWACSRVLVER